MAEHILVTGASRGIGKAIVETFCERYSGQIILSLLARNTDNLQALREQLKDKAVEIHCYSIDVSDHQKLMETVAAINTRQAVDIAVINAGISGNTRRGWESWEQINAIMDTNALGLMATIQPLIEPMQQRRRGKIALIGSISSYRGMALTPSYCASKAAVMSYGESLRGWLQPCGVNVITVLPGFVASEMSSDFPGPKRMLVPARRAAAKIVTGIEKGRAVVAFPFWLVLGIRILTWLPAGLGDRILRQLGYGRSI